MKLLFERTGCGIPDRVLVCGLYCLTVASCIADDFYRFSPDCVSEAGRLMAYRSVEGNTNRICLVQHAGSNTWLTAFVKDAKTTHAPLCLSSSVVTVAPIGVITKYDINGNIVFSEELPGFKGASKLSRKWDNDRIMVAETWSPSPGAPLQHALVWVDVSGSRPIVQARLTTIAQVQLHRIREEIVVVGEEIVQRYRAPKELRETQPSDQSK
jgi:hypothetical protein